MRQRTESLLSLVLSVYNPERRGCNLISRGRCYLNTGRCSSTGYSERWNNLPVAFEDPRGARRDKDVVPRNIDDRLRQQPIPENQSEGGCLLLVEEKRAVQALNAEEVPVPCTAERAGREGYRKSRQGVLVRDLQVTTVSYKNAHRSEDKVNRPFVINDRLKPIETSDSNRSRSTKILTAFISPYLLCCYYFFRVGWNKCKQMKETEGEKEKEIELFGVKDLDWSLISLISDK